MARYVIGIATLAIAIVALAVGSRSIRRRFMPDLGGQPALVAEIVVALSFVVVTLEVLGTFGLFAIVPVIAVTCIGAAAVYTGRRARTASPCHTTAATNRADMPSETVGWARYAAVLAVSVASADWLTRTVDSLHHGITATVDTLWYHLPYAARFAQTGFTSRLVFPDAGSYTAFFPASSELFHGVGIVLLSSDVLSPLLNLGWLALALLSAWCIGRRFGVGSIALIGVAIVLTTPELILDDAGSALTDVVGLALFLASLALLISATPVREEGPTSGGTVAAAGLAAGLALGTKYTMIAPVGLLTVGMIVIAARQRRAALFAKWTVAMLVTGSYWYVRNLLRVGNPTPSLAIGLGPIHLNHVKTPGALSVTRIMFDRHNWTAYLLPGLSTAFGRAWWAILALTFAGCVLGLIRGPELTVRIIAAVGIASFIAYLLSPEILGSVTAPIQFAANVRYCASALVVGAVVLPIAATSLGKRWVSAVLVAYVSTLIATQIAPTLWAHRLSGVSGRTQGWMPEVVGIAAGVTVLLGGCLWLASSPHTRERAPLRVPAVTITIVALAAGGAVLNRYYLDHRYQNVAGMTKIYRWSRDVKDARIALVGTFLQYPLDGKDSSNYVQYLAQRHSDGTSTPIPSCEQWRETLNQGEYDYVVVTTNQFPFPSKLPTPQVGWTAHDPAVSLLINEAEVAPKGFTAQAWLYKIHGKLNPGTCAPGI